METESLIIYLKEDYNLRHPYDKRIRNKIIKRLKEYDELRAYLHKDVLDEIERLRKRSGKNGVDK